MEHERGSPQPNANYWASKTTWMRGLFMLIFVVAFGICQSLIMLVAFIQFVWQLFDGQPNRNLQNFGRSLSRWIAETTEYLTFAREERPFPWSDWPSQAD